MEKQFYVIMKNNVEPYGNYYLTHDLFYTDYDISYSFQDNCLFNESEFKNVKEYLKKDSEKYYYKYEIIFESEEK